jgi:hypothetical protein
MALHEAGRQVDSPASLATTPILLPSEPGPDTSAPSFLNNPSDVAPCEKNEQSFDFKQVLGDLMKQQVICG